MFKKCDTCDKKFFGDGAQCPSCVVKGKKKEENPGNPGPENPGTPEPEEQSIIPAMPEAVKDVVDKEVVISDEPETIKMAETPEAPAPPVDNQPELKPAIETEQAENPTQEEGFEEAGAVEEVKKDAKDEAAKAD